MKLNHSLTFIHGFTGSSHSWDEIRQNINQPSIAIDIPGHGKNHILDSENQYSFNDWNTYLFKEFSQEKKINLCGYSMGGRLALSFALTYPEKINSLILVSTNPGISQFTDKQKRITHDLKNIKEIKTNYSNFVSNWEKLSLFENQKNRNPKSFQKQKQIRLSQNSIQLALSLQYLGQGIMPNYWNKLANINFSVLIICGDEDNKYCDISKKLHSNINNSQFEIIQNSGHAPHVDQQNIFTNLINEFISNEI